MALDYFFDGQLRRYCLQFTRIFEGMQWASGKTPDGKPFMRVLPASMAVKDRQVGHILRNNSENTLNTVPRITCDIASISIARERTQFPNHVSKVQVWEREINPIDQKYMETLGKNYTVERYMAVPYDLTMQMDLWTSNELQKQQIMEQIMILFNPSIDLQTGTNPIDWTSLTIVELIDITWSSRGIQIGTEDQIEISSMTFRMPIWISPPAKVKRQSIIQQIITNIGELDNLEGYGVEGADMYFGDDEFLSQLITTPGNHMVDVSGNEITLLGANGAHRDDSGNVYEWEPLLLKYSKFRPSKSQLRLKTTPDMDDHESDIVGTLEYHPVERNKLLWTINMDSLPRNTLVDINGVIDPHATSPGDGLPEASNGQRYMILKPVGPGSQTWGSLVADTFDIIQYVNGEWTLSFDSSESTSEQIVLNTRTSKQLKWKDSIWQLAVDGTYHTGFWRLFLGQ